MAEWLIRIGESVFDAGPKRLEGATVLHGDGGAVTVVSGGRVVSGAVERSAGRLVVHHAGRRWEFEVGGRTAPHRAADAASEIVAPMTGRVVATFVATGERVAAGAALVVVEAMKMEHRLVAPQAALVVALHVKVGDQVDLGARVATLSYGDAP